MWCSSCQQDVPGIASPNGVTAVGCARCGSDLSLQTRDRSAIDVSDSDALSSDVSGVCHVENSETLSPISPDASSPIAWDQFDWDEELQHAECVLQELHALRDTCDRGDTQADMPPPRMQAASTRWRRTRRMRQRRIGWLLTMWGMGSIVPYGLWTMWFVFQNDSLWLLGAVATFLSLVTLLFGSVLVLHAHARQAEAIAGILQFAVHELSDLREAAVGRVPNVVHDPWQDPEHHRDNRAA